MLFDSVIKHTKNIIGKTGPSIVLGLSGGPDSVFLFHVLVALKKSSDLSLVAAHLDHEWRESSGADAKFCANLCSSADVPLVSVKASELSIKIKFNGSNEDIGRRMRRHLFEQVRQEHAAHFIALAHHRQDQQETFFLRLTRGATLNGLTCMRPLADRYLRPLLGIDKQEIITYLDTHDLKYCIDPTNETETYLRNRIRKHIIPALGLIDARIDQKLDDTIAHLQEEDAYLQELAQENFEKIFSTENLLGGSPQASLKASPGSARGDLRGFAKGERLSANLLIQSCEPFPPAPPRSEQLVGKLPEFKKLAPVMQRRVLMLWLIAEQVPFNPSSAFFNELLCFINRDAGGRHTIGSWTIVKKSTNIWITHNRLQNL